MRDNSLELASYAASHGMRMFVENHAISPGNGPQGTKLLPMTQAEELVRLIKEVDHPALGLLVDMGHLKVAAQTLGFDKHRFLDQVAPYTGALHLSDNNGQRDSHEVFGPDSWFLPRLRDFDDAVIILEFTHNTLRDITAALDLVAKYL